MPLLQAACNWVRHMRKLPGDICSIAGCDKPRKRCGKSMSSLCSMHSCRKWRHGDPLTKLNLMLSTKQEKIDAFMGRFDRSENGCWDWSHQVAVHGYGVFLRGYAHRFSYELFKGPIPKGLEIDHLCRNRKCVNPDHLEAVTASINQRRGMSVSGKNSRKYHCPRGHALIDGNLVAYRLAKYGQRECRICANSATLRRYYGKRKNHELSILQAAD